MKEQIKVWLLNKLHIFLLFVSLIYLVGLILASALTPIPIGTDVYFHYDVARHYANFELGMFSDTVLEMNQFPYPPLYHLLLVPSIWAGLENVFARLMQICLPFLIYLSTVIFIGKLTNPKTQLITALLLTSTMGFVDGTIQARPQGLSMILVPVALYFYIKRADNKFVASSAAVTYTHGIAGLANLWTLMIYGFLKKHWTKTFIKLTIVLSPILLSTILYVGGAMSKWGGMFDTYQEYLIFTEPFTMIPYYSGMTLIGWIYLLYNLATWSKRDMLEKTLCLSLIGLTIMIPLWADRFLQYSTLTLACLSAIGLAKSSKAQKIVLPLIVLMYVLVMANLYWITFTNNWWLYPQ